jgi:hypothetical protein
MLCPPAGIWSPLRGGGQKQELQTSPQNEIVQEIEAILGRQSIASFDFEAVEMAARRQALSLAARGLEQRLNADTSDYAGPELSCSAEALPNIMAVTRRPSKACWGHCCLSALTITVSHARADSAPHDPALGLGLFSLTPGVLRKTTKTATLVSFEENSGLLHELPGGGGQRQAGGTSRRSTGDRDRH